MSHSSPAGQSASVVHPLAAPPPAPSALPPTPSSLPPTPSSPPAPPPPWALQKDPESSTSHSWPALQSASLLHAWPVVSSCTLQNDPLSSTSHSRPEAQSSSVEHAPPAVPSPVRPVSTLPQPARTTSD